MTNLLQHLAELAHAFLYTWIFVVFVAIISVYVLRSRPRWRKQFTRVEYFLRLTGFGSLAVILFATGLTLDNPGADPKSYQTDNDERRTIMQFFGGLGALVALLFGGIRAIHNEEEIAQSRRLKQEELLQSKWQNALDSLGKGTATEPQLEARIVALLTLGTLRLENQDAQVVVETICRYVRVNAKKQEPSRTLGKEGESGAAADAPNDGIPKMREDIECAVASIRLITSREGWTCRPMSLEGAYLPGADFRNAKLSGWNFQNTILEKADFRGARLKRVKMNRANLSGAQFDGNTILSGASMNECNLDGLNARKARFLVVDLEAARIGPDKGTDFRDCKFMRAILSGVDVHNALTNEATQFIEVIGFEKKQAPPLVLEDNTAPATIEELLGQ